MTIRIYKCRTWAPRGQTPILQYNFKWKSLSVAAALTLLNVYFRIYARTIKKEQVVDFLKALVRHLDHPLLIVWDRLPGHRSWLVQDYIASLQGWISTFRTLHEIQSLQAARSGAVVQARAALDVDLTLHSEDPPMENPDRLIWPDFLFLSGLNLSR
jgi:hypothetical protein